MESSKIIVIIAKRLSIRWNIPEYVLIKIYRLYHDHAIRHGDLIAFVKGLNFVMDKRRIKYLIETIQEEKERDAQKPPKRVTNFDL